MVKILSKPLELSRVVDAIKATDIGTEFQVFDRDVGRDEVVAHKSFFFYNENGTLSLATNSNQYKKDFVLMFVSRTGVVIGEEEQIKLINRLRKCGLIFQRTEEEVGQLLGTEESVVAVTFFFTRIIKVCLDED